MQRARIDELALSVILSAAKDLIPNEVSLLNVIRSFAALRMTTLSL